MTKEVLDGVDAIRKRPWMYVGNTEESESVHHLAFETLLHAVEEHFAGPCLFIEVAMHGDGSLSVAYGPGTSPTDDASWLEKLVSLGPTAKGVVLFRPINMIGLVSALSSALSAEVRSGDKAWRIELERGRVTKPGRALGPTERSGTTIRFTPDANIFAAPAFDAVKVERRVRELSALCPGLTMRFSHDGAEREYTSRRGVVQLLAASVHGHAAGEARHETARAQVAFTWKESDDASVVGYYNLEALDEGSHIEGFRQGLADALPGDSAGLDETLARGLHAAVAVLVIHRHHDDTVAAKEVFAVVREATKRALEAEPALLERLQIESA